MTRRRAAAALAVCAALVEAIWCAGAASANVDGATPGPGLCDYPGIGSSGAAFGEYDYACAFPTEINGSHWQALYGGGMWEATGGVSILFINASVTTPVGVLRGVTYWACPDLSVAAPPNPPGAWKDAIRPSKCVTVAPRPQLQRDDAPPPAPPFGLPPPPPPLLPPVTNPDNPNPDATQNP